jgi:hypothetical protein
MLYATNHICLNLALMRKDVLYNHCLLFALELNVQRMNHVKCRTGLNIEVVVAVVVHPIMMVYHANF